MVHRSRSALFATLLALLAVIGMASLAGVHAATIHDDEPAHVMASVSSAVSAAANDLDHSVHLAAHAVGHGLAVPVAASTPRLSRASVIAWPMADLSGLPGDLSASLLRPPRA